ncbi:hypothetical protein CO172_02210 [Candidatus Uhrbacteria bacterium CG_4_9_14_3_um_filter_36_7]|uniref:Uncharacterized protein n=1 Tax=Candidatus Uhrbacteria bacterium CG_4_9_14_3_um_filter_36_7 TaxID=1975033 RepID=A0A2M7XHD1_9BACT|nr:MAG: hypothetical protein CO172_02210 [Candidatus Uhrbacteria bacterium CG_4_9_14_3_um_filter_36_7]
MKKNWFWFFSLFIVIVFFGAGCPNFFSQNNKSNMTPYDEQEEMFVYKDPTYKFVLEYPSGIEIKPRPSEFHKTDYLGIPVDFFLSIRDYRQGTEAPENIFYVYSADSNLTTDTFINALIASDPSSISILNQELIEQGKLTITKIVSTTASGVEKRHYLFSINQSVIIFSEFLHQQEVADVLIASMQLD